MREPNTSYINISAPNLLTICIDRTDDGEIGGRFYHCYDHTPVVFSSVVELMTKAERFFDEIAFPQASTMTRKFHVKETTLQTYNKRRPEKVVDQTEIIRHTGEKATFVVWVKFRQNSTWQGEAVWMEEGIKKRFANILELTSRIDKALQKIEKS